tara:strand:- start:184 stop:711 length:528 start_codon:yes stop_codon:yes gene_type:complete
MAKDEEEATPRTIANDLVARAVKLRDELKGHGIDIRANGPGAEQINAERLVIPAKYWIGFFSGLTIAILSVSALHFNTISGLKEYVSLSVQGQALKEERRDKEQHSKLYRPAGEETVNERIGASEGRIGVLERGQTQVMTSLGNLQSGQERMLRQVDRLAEEVRSLALAQAKAVR